MSRPADGSFLTGTELSDAIRYVLGGADRSCAVAFWGIGSRELVDDGAGLEDLRVVCDISLGACHPDALRSLGAPANAAIRYHDGLHAKLFMSDFGMVVGSANASANGIGFGSDDAGLLEAGTFHMPTSEAWKTAAGWFDALHSDAIQVDDAAIERARRLFHPRRGKQARRVVRPGSLLDMVVAEPERFDGIGFVLASALPSDEERATARKAALKAGVDTDVVENTSDNDVFIGWDKKDVLRWPVTFIELWMPRNRLYLHARTLKAVDAATGNVFTKKDRRALSRLVPDGLPDFAEAERQDGAIVARLLVDGSKVFRTASEFAAAIEASS